jgi:hypothetical protein
VIVVHSTTLIKISLINHTRRLKNVVEDINGFKIAIACAMLGAYPTYFEGEVVDKLQTVVNDTGNFSCIFRF